jgi:hypothetical protein
MADGPQVCTIVPVAEGRRGQGVQGLAAGATLLRSKSSLRPISRASRNRVFCAGVVQNRRAFTRCPPRNNRIRGLRSKHPMTTLISGSKRSTDHGLSLGWKRRTRQHCSDLVTRALPPTVTCSKPSSTGLTTSLTPIEGREDIQRLAGRYPSTRPVANNVVGKFSQRNAGLGRVPRSRRARRPRKRRLGVAGAVRRCRLRTSEPSFTCRAAAATQSCCANSTSCHANSCRTVSTCRNQGAASSGSTATRCCCRRPWVPEWRPVPAWRGRSGCGGGGPIRWRRRSSSKRVRIQRSSPPRSTETRRRNVCGSSSIRAIFKQPTGWATAADPNCAWTSRVMHGQQRIGAGLR